MPTALSDSHMLIADIDGIAPITCSRMVITPLEQIKERFIAKYLLLLIYKVRLKFNKTLLAI
ncbi:hypothetical protein O9992_15275 [Vibrio lentus]|nr:hypothetical protein [Vibrio lentus]